MKNLKAQLKMHKKGKTIGNRVLTKDVKMKPESKKKVKKIKIKKELFRNNIPVPGAADVELEL